MNVTLTLKVVGVAAMALAACAASAVVGYADTVPTVVSHIHDHPLPSSLDLRGRALQPIAQFIPCSAVDRRKIEPDVEAVQRLVDAAGGMRVRSASFPVGKRITTPDGMRFTLEAAGASYVVAADSSHARGLPQQYFDDCISLASANERKIRALGLTLPVMNADTPQYAPSVGFYIVMDV
ncbi:MAG: hypothetical protein KGN02_13905 [bacterium]|nr:hypothetical protein [bacterium]